MSMQARPLRFVSSVLLVQRAGRTRDMHAIVLMTRGYEVDCTSNAIHAWQMWETKQPDLVLFALEVYDPQLFHLIDWIRRSQSSQLIGFLWPRLCSVSYNGNIVRRAREADNILEAVEANSPDTASSSRVSI